MSINNESILFPFLYLNSSYILDNKMIKVFIHVSISFKLIKLSNSTVSSYKLLDAMQDLMTDQLFAFYYLATIP